MGNIWLRFLKWLASKLQQRIITNEFGNRYLLRCRLYGWMPGCGRSYPFSIYLHRFFRPDTDRSMHSHPWRWSLSLILAGGYWEWRLVGHDFDGERFKKPGRAIIRRVKPWRINFLGTKSFHRIADLRGSETWTLFIAGPKFQKWGFEVWENEWVPDSERKFIPHTEYFQGVRT